MITNISSKNTKIVPVRSTVKFKDALLKLCGMTCDPSEHNFVNESSYSIELETDSAVVETLEEEKRCKHCGKTPDELDDFVTESQTAESDTSDSTSGDVNETVDTADDDAVIMNSDNSEQQSGSSQHKTPPSEEEVEDISEGDQTDDAYIIGGDAVGTSDNSETADVDEELEDQWSGSTNEVDEDLYVGPMLFCPNCGFEIPQTSAPQYPGDSCPECRKAYLKRE